MAGYPLWVYDVRRDDGQPVYYLSILEPGDFTRQIPREAILGQLTAGPDHIDAEHVMPNEVFAKFLCWVIAKHAAGSATLMAEVARQRNGYVYLSDARVRNPDGSVALEDIIGGVEIADGKLVRFHGMPSYRVFTAAGSPDLDPYFRARHLEELAALQARGS